MPEIISLIYRETADEDSQFQLLVMRIGQGANFIENGFMQWGYKIYEDYAVSDSIGDSCPNMTAISTTPRTTMQQGVRRQQ